MLIKLTLTGIVLVLATYLYRLTRNYTAARHLSLPIVICPFTWQDRLWVLIANCLQLRHLLHLPGLTWLRYSHMGWPLHETHHSHVRFGPAFIVVSAGRNEIVLHDPKAIVDVLVRYKKWERPREAYSIFSLFGENVDSASAYEWPRHRRVINAAFTESNMKIVWKAAEMQVGQWLKQGTISFRELSEAMDTITVNVLMNAGFGQDYSLKEESSTNSETDPKSFKGALHLITTNLSYAWAVKNKRGLMLIKSNRFKMLQQAMKESRANFKDVLCNTHGSFIQCMLGVNNNEKECGRPPLNEEELCGNLFILYLAGSDTTSYAMSFTLAMMSIHPGIQDWIREDFIEGEYSDAYPRTIRCRAAITETLRLFTPAPSLSRHALGQEVLTVAGKNYIIPPDTLITGNLPCIHNDPQIWGDDAGEWKPQRWIEIAEDGAEVLKERSEMMAWSTGPRVCPGKKFSLVEIVAVICTVLSDYRLEGTANMVEMLRDFEYSVTPKPRRPEGASIKFVKLAKTKTQ